MHPIIGDGNCIFTSDFKELIVFDSTNIQQVFSYVLWNWKELAFWNYVEVKTFWYKGNNETSILVNQDRIDIYKHSEIRNITSQNWPSTQGWIELQTSFAFLWIVVIKKYRNSWIMPWPTTRLDPTSPFTINEMKFNWIEIIQLYPN